MSLARFDTWIRSAIGPAAAGASVFICGQPATVSSNPTPQVQLYSDVAGALPIAQPLVADGFGHVYCYIASGTYTIVVVYGGQLVLSYPDQVIAAGSGNAGTYVTGLPSVITAPAGDVITADGSGNAQDGGVLLSSLAPVNNAGLTGTTTVQRLNNVRYADRFPGSDTGQQIANAIADLPSTGGTVDALAFTGVNPWTSDPFSGVTKPVVLITGPATFEWNTAVMSVNLPSHFIWQAYGTTVRSTAPYVSNNTVGQGGLINNVNYTPNGSITSGTNSLVVSNATGIEIGTLVGIIGAAGIETKQATTINQLGGIAAGDTNFIVASTSGWSVTSSFPNNYIQIDTEIMSYGGGSGTTFTGVTRGLFGTTAASHANGAPVSAVPFLLSMVTAVAGTTITIEDNATQTVAGAYVIVGAQDIHILGTLTLDGRKDGVTLRELSGLVFDYGTRCEVGPAVKVYNCDTHGLVLVACRFCDVGALYENNGTIPLALGVDCFLFTSCLSNNVHTVAHRNGNVAFLADDRSSTYQPSAGPSNGNVAFLGPITGSNYGPNGGQSCVSVEGGSSYNTIYVPYLKCKPTGFAMSIVSAQWTSNPVPRGNIFRFSTIDNAAGTSIFTSGYTPDLTDVNYFQGGTPLGTVSITAGDQWQYNEPVAGRLTTYRPAGNAYDWQMFRSGGNTGFPDIFGDGVNALVLGGKGDGSGTVSFGATTSVVVPGALTIAGAGSGSVSIVSPAAPSTWTLTLPTTHGTAGQVMLTDGSGITSWGTPGPVSGQNVWIAAANGFATANFAQGVFAGNTMGNCLSGRYALCMPAVWKVSFQAFSGNTTKIAACAIVVCPADSPVASSRVVVLFSGIGTATFTAELTSDPISLQIDAEHDYYLMVYYDGTSGNPGYWQSNGINAAVFPVGAAYSTTNNTNPTNILTTPSSPSTNNYIHFKKITVA